jgi:hypothetical protein
MPSEFIVEFAPHGKAVVYREGQSTFAFEVETRGKHVEVDFSHHAVSESVTSRRDCIRLRV